MLCGVGVLSVLALATQARMNSVDVSNGDVRVVWQSATGMSIVYRGVEAFSAYPDEFTLHDPGWTTAYYRSREGNSTATWEKRGRTVVVQVADDSQHFFYRKRVSLFAEGRIVEEFEYGQRDLDKASLQLGWRPAVEVLDGAAFSVLSGSGRQSSVMTRGYSGQRVLFDGATELQFRSAFGAITIKSSRPMTLYDYRNQGQFWLGWDVPLEKGRIYRERVEVTFAPGSAEGGGVRLSDLTWSRRVTDGYFKLSGTLARSPGGPQTAALVVTASRGEEVALRRRSELRLSKPVPAAVSLPLPQPGSYSVGVTITSPDGQELLRLPDLKVDVAKILSAVPSLSLYTTETRGELLVRIGPDVPLDECAVAVEGKGFPRTEVKPSARSFEIPFDLAPLADGLYDVE
ncbi:MAG: hypothetical protein H5T86_10560, partial [Armatimonadetes bacterium]|nr:hypothetical protein [Armatimonadota bacterium]